MIEKLFNDITILIGENAFENNSIIVKQNPKYYWFHLKNGSSPHGILMTTNPSKTEIFEVARLVKDHSKERFMNNIKVNYTQIKNLKLTNVPGTVILKNKPKVIKI